MEVGRMLFMLNGTGTLHRYLINDLWNVYIYQIYMFYVYVYVINMYVYVCLSNEYVYVINMYVYLYEYVFLK